jgi:hypothetical protein
MFNLLPAFRRKDLFPASPALSMIVPFPLIFLFTVIFSLSPLCADESDGFDGSYDDFLHSDLFDTGFDDAYGENFNEDRPVKVLRPGGPLSSSIPIGETPEHARLILEDILQSPDMGSEQETWGIRFKSREEPEPERKEGEMPSWMEDIKKAVANILRFILIGGIIVFAAFAFFHFYRKFRGGKGSFSKAVQNRVVPDAAISAESYLARARRLNEQNRVREAWAACLAGSLAALKLSRGISFPANATEYGCLALIRSALRQSTNAEQQPDANRPDPSRELEEFTGLIHNWVYFAYAGQPPPENAFEKALNFGLSLLPAESSRNSEKGRHYA